MSEQAQEKTAAKEGKLERHKRVMYGHVVSNKMDKTIVVQISRRFRHPRYKKYVNEQVRYKAHDARNEANVGDRVSIVECRPLSRDKRWRLQKVLERAPIV